MSSQQESPQHAGKGRWVCPSARAEHSTGRHPSGGQQAHAGRMPAHPRNAHTDTHPEHTQSVPHLHTQVQHPGAEHEHR